MVSTINIMKKIQAQPILRFTVIAGFCLLTGFALAQSQTQSQGQSGDQSHPTTNPRMTTGSKEGGALVNALAANAKAEAAAIDHELLPAYHKALALQKAGKTDELDAFLLKLRLTKLVPRAYEQSTYGTWMIETLIEDLMNKGDMRTIWIVDRKPSTKDQFISKPLGEAAAASIGVTYPGEYEDLRKQLGWKTPDEDWAKPFDRGDCAWSDEALSLLLLNNSTGNFDDPFCKHETDFALKRLYRDFAPGNDNIFISLLWTDGFSDPTEALAAFHRHFPGGVPEEVTKRDQVPVLLNSLSMAQQQAKNDPEGHKTKYTGPEK